MWGPEQRHRALEQAVPIGQAQAVLIYRPGAQGRSIMGNNVKFWILLPILICYCLFLPIIDLAGAGDPFSGRSIIGKNKH